MNILGFECRPIVAGNFAKNAVVDYFDYETHDDLGNASWIDENGLFIGNHHVNMNEALKYQKKMRKNGYSDCFVVAFKDGEKTEF